MSTERDLVLHDLVVLLRRTLAPGLLAAIGAALAMVLMTFVFEAKFEASSSLFLAARNDPTPPQLESTLRVTTRPDVRAYEIAAASPAVAAAALELAGMNNPTPQEIEEFSRRVKVRSDGEDAESSSLVIAVSSSDAAQAARLANSLAAALLAWDRERANESLAAVIATLEAQVAGLGEIILEGSTSGGDQAALQGRLLERQLELASLRAIEGSAAGYLQLLTSAVPPVRSSSPSRLVLAILGLFIGYATVLAVSMFRSAVDPRFRSPEEVVALLGLPILAQASLRARGHRRDLLPETIRRLRAELNAAAGGDKIVVVVAGPTEDKSSSAVAIGLAKGFAQLSDRTLLVDANLRRPSVADEFGVRGRPPASLNKQLREPNRRVPPMVVSDGKAVLHLVPAFDENPSHLDLMAAEFAGLVAGWSSEFDVVVINAAPVVAYSETLSFVAGSSGTILVVDLATTFRRDVVDAVAALQRANGRIFGLMIVHPRGRTRRDQRSQAREHRSGGLNDSANWTARQLTAAHAGNGDAPDPARTGERLHEGHSGTAKST